MEVVGCTLGGIGGAHSRWWGALLVEGGAEPPLGMVGCTLGGGVQNSLSVEVVGCTLGSGVHSW